MIILLSYFFVFSKQIQSAPYSALDDASNEIDFKETTGGANLLEISSSNLSVKLDESTNYKTVIILEHIENVSFLCGDNQRKIRKLQIFGQPDIYLEGKCSFHEVEIYNFPFFYKKINSTFKINNVQIVNPKYQFPFKCKSIQYVNKTNFGINNKTSQKSQSVENFCFSDSQEFANHHCSGILEKDTQFSITNAQDKITLFIQYSTPTMLTFSFEDTVANSQLELISDQSSSEITVKLVKNSQNSISINVLKLENVHITADLDNDNPLVLAVQKISTIDSTIENIEFDVPTDTFYFISNTAQSISVQHFSEKLKYLILVNVTVVCQTLYLFKDVDMQISHAKLSSNLHFCYEAPGSSIVVSENSEIAIESITDGYNLEINNSILHPIVGAKFSIQNLKIINSETETSFDFIEFSFAKSSTNDDLNSTIYSDKIINLKVISIGDITSPLNFRMTNINIENDFEIYIYNSFNLYTSHIYQSSVIFGYGNNISIGFYDIEETPTIYLHYISYNGMLFLYNAVIQLSESPELDYVKLEANAKIYNNELTTQKMELPYSTFLEHSELMLSFYYIIYLSSPISIEFTMNNVELSSESHSITFDSRSTNSLIYRISCVADSPLDITVVNETTDELNFSQILYSINQGKYGNGILDKFTRIIDEDDHIWSFQTIEIKTGILPFLQLSLNNPISYIKTDEINQLFEFRAIYTEASELYINSNIYTNYLYSNGMTVHFLSKDNIFKVDNLEVHANGETRSFSSDERDSIQQINARSLAEEDYSQIKCTQSTQNNSFIINKLDIFAGNISNHIPFSGFLTVNSIYLNSSNSLDISIPNIFGANCFNLTEVYLNHSLTVNDSYYYFGNECLLSITNEFNILKSTELQFNPKIISEKDVRILCATTNTTLAQTNFGKTVLYLPNEENIGKIVTINFDYVVLAFGVIMIFMLLYIIITVSFTIRVFRYDYDKKAESMNVRNPIKKRNQESRVHKTRQKPTKRNNNSIPHQNSNAEDDGDSSVSNRKADYTNYQLNENNGEYGFQRSYSFAPSEDTRNVSFNNYQQNNGEYGFQKNYTFAHREETNNPDLNSYQQNDNNGEYDDSISSSSDSNQHNKGDLDFNIYEHHDSNYQYDDSLSSSSDSNQHNKGDSDFNIYEHHDSNYQYDDSLSSCSDSNQYSHKTAGNNNYQQNDDNNEYEFRRSITFNNPNEKRNAGLSSHHRTVKTHHNNHHHPNRRSKRNTKSTVPNKTGNPRERNNNSRTDQNRNQKHTDNSDMSTGNSNHCCLLI